MRFILAVILVLTFVSASFAVDRGRMPSNPHGYQHRYQWVVPTHQPYSPQMLHRQYGDYNRYYQYQYGYPQYNQRMFQLYIY